MREVKDMRLEIQISALKGKEKCSVKGCFREFAVERMWIRRISSVNLSVFYQL